MKYKIIFIACVLLQISVRTTLAKPYFKWNTLEANRSLYIEPESKYTWFEAMSECALRNMSLITIDEPEKNDAIIALLKDKFGKPLNFWIGGHDNGGVSQFVWSSTGKHLAFTNWLDGRPDNNKEGPNCLLILNSSEWEDNRCTNKLGAICEENHFVKAAQQSWEVKKHFIEQLFAL